MDMIFIRFHMDMVIFSRIFKQVPSKLKCPDHGDPPTTLAATNEVGYHIYQK